MARQPKDPRPLEDNGAPVLKTDVPVSSPEALKAVEDLTLLQRRFVYHYLNDGTGSAREAARKAGYRDYTTSAKLTSRHPAVKAAIAANVKEAGLSIPEILHRLADQATASMEDFTTIDESGAYRLDLKKARDNGKLHLVHSLVPTKHGLGIKLHDQQAALVHLGRIHGLFIERIKLSRDFNPEEMTTEELKAIAEGKA